MNKRINQKTNYNESFYDKVDEVYNNWRRPVWEEHLWLAPQERGDQIGPAGWVEVLDAAGNVIVNIDGDGFTGNLPAHADDHENGGSDEISVAGLSGLLADGQTPLPHDTSHQNGGTDEISVAGLSGLLADPQTPLGHAVSHGDGGSDELSITTLPTAEVDTTKVLKPDGLGGVAWGADAGGGSSITGIDVDEAGAAAATDVQTVDFQSGFDVTEPVAGTAAVALDLTEVTDFTDHSARHENGGADEISVAGLSGLLADAQTPLGHNASHENGGADEIEVDDLGTAEVDTSKRLAPDGLGGVLWAAGGGGGGITGVEVKESEVSAATDVQTIDFWSGFDVSENPAGTARVTMDLLEVPTFSDHSARHEDGGADEISIEGLTGMSAQMEIHRTAVAGPGVHNASAITVADAGALFVASEVEGALQEIAAGFAPWLIPPLYGYNQDGTASHVGAANRTVYVPVHITGSCTVTGIRWVCVGSNGNVCVALYSSAGVRLATSGSVACPAVGLATTNFASSYAAKPGRYYLAFGSSTTTTFTMRMSSATANITLQNIYENSFPAPANISSAGGTNTQPAMYGVVSGGF